MVTGWPSAAAGCRTRPPQPLKAVIVVNHKVWPAAESIEVKVTVIRPCQQRQLLIGQCVMEYKYEIFKILLFYVGGPWLVAKCLNLLINVQANPVLELFFRSFIAWTRSSSHGCYPSPPSPPALVGIQVRVGYPNISSARPSYRWGLHRQLPESTIYDGPSREGFQSDMIRANS